MRTLDDLKNMGVVRKAEVPEVMPFRDEPLPISRGRDHEVWHYAAHHGLIGFVDAERKRWVAADCPQIKDAVKIAGYTEGPCSVPYSYDPFRLGQLINAAKPHFPNIWD